MSVKIFISCVSKEFLAYRDHLSHQLRRLNVEIIVQEDFKDLATVTLDMLDAYVRASDAVVHLIGDMTGAAAKPASTGCARWNAIPAARLSMLTNSPRMFSPHPSSTCWRRT
jgi:hypothetical protein